jgi:hypothetical protein
MVTTKKPQDLPTIDLSSTGTGVLSRPPNDTGTVIPGDTLSFQLDLCHQASHGCGDVHQRGCGGEPPYCERRGRHPVLARVISRSLRGHRRRSDRLQLTATGVSSLWRLGPVSGTLLLSLGKAMASRNPLDSPAPAS